MSVPWHVPAQATQLQGRAAAPAASLKWDRNWKRWNLSQACLPKHVHLIQQKLRRPLSKEQLWPRSQFYKAELLKSQLSAMKCPLWFWFKQAGMCCLIQVWPEGVRAERCPPFFSSQLPRARKKGDAPTIAPQLLNYLDNEKYNWVFPTSPYFLWGPVMFSTYSSVNC